MDNENYFEDLTIEEAQLFGKNIGQPFSDAQYVFRSVITAMTAELAQNSEKAKTSWYRQLLNGRSPNWKLPEPELPEVPTNLTGVALTKWIRTQENLMREAEELSDDSLWLCWMSDLVGEDIDAQNLTEWCVEIIEEYGNEMSATALRRAVVDELRAESASAGEWDTWLIHFAWIAHRREAMAEGSAPIRWFDFIANEYAETQKSLGITYFMRWVANRQTLDDEPEDDEDYVSDIPLENSTSEGISETEVADTEV